MNACEVEAGKDNVLHLAINSGTDLALFNAWLTEIAAKGWIDKAFIAASHQRTSTRRSRPTRPASTDAAQITGLSVDQIRQVGRMDRPAESRAARAGARCSAYEKGLIWGNDNYRTNGALVNIALATGNIGRPGGGCVRMGGHQEGYVRPDYPGGRPALYIDQLLIGGKGGIHHIWGCDHYKTTLNALEFKHVYKRRTDLVKDAMSTVPYGDRTAQVEGDHGRNQQRRLVRRRC